MGGKSLKMEKVLDAKETEALASCLCDVLGVRGCLEPGDVDRFKLVVKYGEQGVTAKLKIGYPAERAPEGATDDECIDPTEERVKYDKLKKRMKKSFKAIVESVEQGEPLPAEAVESFVADSAVMVSFPGYGDQYYKEYMKAHKAFVAACGDGDPEAIREAVEALAYCKDRCHALYKD